MVTDRWQRYTSLKVGADTLKYLSNYCGEFLVHGVDVEGKQQGIEQELVALLGQHSPITVTYAGGVRSLSDIDLVWSLGHGKVNVSIGSALDIFGGKLSFEAVVKHCEALKHRQSAHQSNNIMQLILEQDSQRLAAAATVTA